METIEYTNYQNGEDFLSVATMLELQRRYFLAVNRVEAHSKMFAVAVDYNLTEEIKRHGKAYDRAQDELDQIFAACERWNIELDDLQTFEK